MTVEQALAQIAARGLRLNNLFELQNDRWRANVRDPSSAVFYEFGEADTPQGAILAALEKCPTEPTGFDVRPGTRAEPAAKAAEPTGVFD